MERQLDRAACSPNGPTRSGPGSGGCCATSCASTVGPVPSSTPRSSATSRCEEFLADGPWSREFLDWYLVPLGAAVWSADPTTFTRFPAAAFARFFDNHGMLRLRDRIPWRTVPGGARRYVDAISRTLGPRAPGRHTDRQDRPARRPCRVARRPQASRRRSITSSSRRTATRRSRCSRTRPAPSARSSVPSGTSRTPPCSTPTRGCSRRCGRAWASWNYQRPVDDAPCGATVTYHMNRLQNLESRHEICLTLNRTDEIRPDAILASIEYAHPVFDRAAMRAQQRHAEISDRDRTSYCGAYWGYGFHEDGVASARAGLRRSGSAVANSAIYEGSVFHRRYQPVPHEFEYQVALRSSTSTSWTKCVRCILSGRGGGPNAVWWRRRDFYGAPEQPLPDAIRDLVRRRDRQSADGARPGARAPSYLGLAVQPHRLSTGAPTAPTRPSRHSWPT